MTAVDDVILGGVVAALVALVGVAAVATDLEGDEAGVVELARRLLQAPDDLGVAPLALLGAQLPAVERRVLEHVTLGVGEAEDVLQQRAAQLLRADLLLGE